MCDMMILSFPSKFISRPSGILRTVRFRLHRSALLSAAMGLGLASSSLAAAQETSKVTVNLGKPVNILTSMSLAAPANLYDGSNYDNQTVPYLKASGLTVLRFPSSSADVYHWSTNTETAYKGIEVGYINPAANIANVAKLTDQTGTAMVVVNYGSNLDGNGGGEPAEAAAWVAYANSDPASSLVIGKDSTGHDWGTAGKWATIRSQAPLATDDGYNFLRIAHPAPLKIKLWQIGSHVYNNGFYGGDHVGEPDLHGPAPTALKDFGKLRKNPKLSAGFYGDQIVEFAKAMKDVDPSIQIGAAFVTPPDGLSWAPDWNATVLKKACSVIDFETLEWLSGGATLPPDWKTMDEDALFRKTMDGGAQVSSPRSQLDGIFTGLLYDDKNNCPKGKTPRIAFNPAGVVTWPKVERPVAEALYIADVDALLVESGSVNISTPELYSDNMVANDRKKVGPVFIGMQMLHAFLHNPGDALVDTTSSDFKLAVHAVKRRDGVFALMLINEDASTAITAKISVSGGQVGSKGRRFDYGLAQQKAGTGIAPVEIKDVGNEFSVTVPQYTITDILIE
jgi:hypothetical protein